MGRGTDRFSFQVILIPPQCSLQVLNFEEGDQTTRFFFVSTRILKTQEEWKARITHIIQTTKVIRVKITNWLDKFESFELEGRQKVFDTVSFSSWRQIREDQRHICVTWKRGNGGIVVDCMWVVKHQWWATTTAPTMWEVRTVGANEIKNLPIQSAISSSTKSESSLIGFLFTDGICEPAAIGVLIWNTD